MTQHRSRLPTSIWIVALTVFLDFFGLTLVIPILPFWATSLGATPLLLGALLTSYALVQLLCTPLLGALSDRRGRRPVMLVSVLLSAASFALAALATSLPLLFLARIVGGLGAANLGAAQAIVADDVPPCERTRAMGVLGAAIGLAHVVGPALGGPLVVRGQALPFWVAFGVALANALLVWRALPETRQRSPAPRREQSRYGWATLLRASTLRSLALISMASTLAFLALETVFALFTKEVFGWSAPENGGVFAYMGAVLVLTQARLIGPLVARWGEQQMLRVGLALLSCGFVALPWATQIAALLLALSVISVGSGLVSPTLMALFSFASPPEAQGEALGLAQSVTSVGRLLGPLLAGGLFSLDRGLPFLLVGCTRMASPSHWSRRRRRIARSAR